MVSQSSVANARAAERERRSALLPARRLGYRPLCLGYNGAGGDPMAWSLHYLVVVGCRRGDARGRAGPRQRGTGARPSHLPRRGLSAGDGWAIASQPMALGHCLSERGRQTGYHRGCRRIAPHSAPVVFKVVTRLDGTPVLARWLEVTNTGATPASLSGVSSCAGLLWNSPELVWRRARL